MNKTDRFLESLVKVKDKEIPEHVIMRYKLALLDYLGVTLAGAKFNGEKLEGLINLMDNGTSSAIGIDKEVSIGNAIFCNGLNAHSLDFDDGVNKGIIHLGSPVFSTLIPLARKYNVSSEKFMKASILGYEATFTMAVSIQPSHKNMGYHATGTCGTLGAALAVANMFEFDEIQIKNTFSAAAVSATGTLKVLEDGSEYKPYNVAKAALMGYTAATMGYAGFTGPDDVLSGDRGFLKLMYGTDEVTLMEPMLSDTFAIEKAYIKNYAACRYCHPSIEAALRIGEKYSLRVDDIDLIEVRTYSLAVYKHDHTIIEGVSSAKMSIPYGVSIALYKGSAGFNEYDINCITDLEVLRLCKLVRVMADKKMSEEFPEKQTAEVTIYTKNGDKYIEKVDFPKGEPENPMTVEEVREKFNSLALYGGRTMKEANEIYEAVMNVEEKFHELIDLIGGTKNHE